MQRGMSSNVSTHGECCHVYFPKDRKKARPSTDKFKNAYEHCERTFPLNCGLMEKPLFLAYPYNSKLLDKGEVQAYLANSVLIYMIHTNPRVKAKKPVNNPMVFGPVTGLRPLTDLK
jgi:hypothetical protein